MKVPILATCTFLIFVFAGVAAAQTVPPDSAPVMQGSARYSMPQSVIDADIDGKVKVAIRVDETGKPTNAVLILGPAWPCGTTPTKALEDLSSTLKDAMMKLRFSPAIKDGKPVANEIGLTFELKNPKHTPKPAEIDPATVKPPKTIIGGVLNGRATYLEYPYYPSVARANHAGGSVTVQVFIDEHGKVYRAGAISGPYSLQYASREAACGSKFTPTLLSGNPVKVSGVITYNFVP
jgi:outer membrane biosynthesis protein TonB